MGYGLNAVFIILLQSLLKYEVQLSATMRVRESRDDEEVENLFTPSCKVYAYVVKPL